MITGNNRSRPARISAIRDTLIVTGIVVLLFGMLEVGIRLLFPQTVRTVFREDRSLGLKDKELGHFNRPNVHTIRSGPEYQIEIKTNPEGLRDQAIHPDPKPPGQTRFLLFGDSFTFGVGNDYDQIWPVIFERNLLERGYDVDVIKAGVCEYDTTVELRLLEKLFPKYSPDVVVFAFLPNDLFTNTPIGQPTYLERKYSNENLESTHTRFRTILSNLHTIILLKRFLFSSDYLYTRLYLSTKRAQYYTLPMNNMLQTQISITKDLLLRAKTYCDKRNALFIVLSIPQQFQVIAKANRYNFDNIDIDLVDGIFSKFASENSFVWIPVLEALADRYQSDRRLLYYRYDGHLTGEGNRVVGNQFSKTFLRLFKNSLQSN